jgi:hypothetical protein
MTIVQLNTAEGVPIEVEVRSGAVAAREQHADGELTLAGAKENVQRVMSSKTFEDALERIRPVANAFIQRIASIDVTPEEVQVKFGLKLSVEADVIISSTAAEANFEFTITWKPKARPVDGTSSKE